MTQTLSQLGITVSQQTHMNSGNRTYWALDFKNNEHMYKFELEDIGAFILLFSYNPPSLPSLTTEEQEAIINYITRKGEEEGKTIIYGLEESPLFSDIHFIQLSKKASDTLEFLSDYNLDDLFYRKEEEKEVEVLLDFAEHYEKALLEQLKNNRLINNRYTIDYSKIIFTYLHYELTFFLDKKDGQFFVNIIKTYKKEVAVEKILLSEPKNTATELKAWFNEFREKIKVKSVFFTESVHLNDLLSSKLTFNQLNFSLDDIFQTLRTVYTWLEIEEIAASYLVKQNFTTKEIGDVMLFAFQHVVIATTPQQTWIEPNTSEGKHQLHTRVMEKLSEDVTSALDAF